MERMIKLNLRSDDERTGPAHLPNPQSAAAELPARSKRLNRILRKATHHAATKFGRGEQGVFSK